MRALAYILIAFGLVLFASAGYDEYRGITRSPGRHHRVSFSRQANPEEFRNAMTYHWFLAALLTIGGVIAYMIDRAQERSDPLSPDFAGNKDLDEWGDELKKEAEEQRKKPKP